MLEEETCVHEPMGEENESFGAGDDGGGKEAGDGEEEEAEQRALWLGDLDFGGSIVRTTYHMDEENEE